MQRSAGGVPPHTLQPQLHGPSNVHANGQLGREDREEWQRGEGTGGNESGGVQSGKTQADAVSGDRSLAHRCARPPQRHRT
eukprot:6576873-Ditylum_brightwellii.AAC.1